MAFDPERLSLITQPVGDGGIRFFSYQTDDNSATLTGTGYFASVEKWGVRPYDLIFVVPLTTGTPYLLTVDSVDASGNGTASLGDDMTLPKEASTFLRRKTDNSGYEARTATQVLSDISAVSYASQSLAESAREQARVNVGITADLTEAKFKGLRRYRSIWEYLDNDPNTTPGAINTAWDAMVADIPARSEVEFPAYDYQLTSSIEAPIDKYLEVGCASGWGTRLVAHANGDWGTGVGQSKALIVQSDEAQHLNTFHMHGGQLLGQNRAPYGIYFARCIHSTFEATEVLATTTWAMHVNGYSNRFLGLKIWGNYGGGLDLSGTGYTGGLGNSSTNIIGGSIYGNPGIGLRLANALGISLTGVGIEGNDIAGIVAYDLRSLTVRGSYFERNAETGYAFTIAGGDPEDLTIKADIILLGNNNRNLASYDTTTDGTGKHARSVVIDGNTLSPYGTLNFPTSGLFQNCFVFAPAMENLRVTNTDILEPTSRLQALVGTYNNNTRAKAQKVVIEGNDRNDVAYFGTGAPSFSFGGGHEISSRFLQDGLNYAPQAVASYTVISGTTGSISDTGNLYAGKFPILSIAAGNRQHGFTIDLSVNTELASKYVWFGCLLRRPSATTNIRLLSSTYSNQDGTITLTGTESAWRVVSIMRPMPSSGTVTFSIGMTGAAGTIEIAAPCLCVVGSTIYDAMKFTTV